MTPLQPSSSSGQTTIDAVCEEIRLQRAKVLEWNKRAVEERERCRRLWDLLSRIRASIADETIDIPDVQNAIIDAIDQEET